MPDNSFDAQLKEVTRRMAAFVTARPQNILLQPTQNGTELLFLNGAERDINLDGLTDRIVLRLGIGTKYLSATTVDLNRVEEIQELWWDPERQKAEQMDAARDAFERSELVGFPVHGSKAEVPRILLLCTPEELLKALPVPGKAPSKDD